MRYDSTPRHAPSEVTKHPLSDRLSLSRYLRDRMVVGALFLLSSALSIVIIRLGVLDRGDVVYIFMLCILCLVVYLIYDYLRHAPLRRELLSTKGQIDDPLRVHSAVTGEEEALTALLESSHQLYTSRLQENKHALERHLEYAQLWVHQMKSPVSVIDLLIQQAPNGVDPEWLESLAEEKERLSEGLEMLLHAARIDKFDTDLRPRTVDLVQLARECVRERLNAFVRNGITPKITASKDTVEVQTDPKWMRFVIGQLLSNAIKYSRLKQVSGLHVDLEITSDEGRILLTVRDEGVGIPPEDLPRIFEPFFTGENGRRTNESTGMGLYLVRQVLDNLGHSMEVSSEPGKGSAFTIAFESRSITSLSRMHI